MKSTPLVLALLILPSTANALNISLESSLYKVKLKGKYRRENGYELWKGKKSGSLYRLLLEDEVRMKNGDYFKLSVTSGTTKAPYVNLFTADSDRLFNGGVRTFTVRELYFHKEHFLLDSLSLTVGKQPFEIGNFLKDYLWGGKFTYTTGGRVKVTWNQIAGYEGKYLLFNDDEEDDIDIFNVKIEKDWLSLGFYRLSDARGKRSGKSKSGATLSIKGKESKITLTTQNGEKSLYGEVKIKGIKLEGGYAGKNFTSYGFKEGVNGIGLIYKPSFRDLRFLKGELNLGPWNLYGLHVESSDGDFIGNEFGVEGERPISKNLALFGKVALGSHNSYALMGGIRWSLKGFKFKDEVTCVNVESLFTLQGEYSDFSKRAYTTQSEYEDYATAKHVGFWHSTYKLKLTGDNFKVKVSTGKNSKIDYLIWGNTADNNFYQRGHGKEWHLEEAWIKRDFIRLGLMEVKLKGFIDENLAGAELKLKGFSFYGLLESNKPKEGGSKPIKYLGAKWKKERTEIYLLYRKGKGSTSTGGISYGNGKFEGGILRQFKAGDDGWGGFLRVNGKVMDWSSQAEYRLYSKEFKTFGLKEYFWNEGFIYRPGEGNLRVLKLTAKRGLKTGYREFDKFAPKLKFFYLKLNRFSGSYVGEEGGFTLSINPGAKCQLSLIGSVGNNSSYYEGVAFKVKW